MNNRIYLYYYLDYLSLLNHKKKFIQIDYIFYF